jgi:hypothetical protein
MSNDSIKNLVPGGLVDPTKIHHVVSGNYVEGLPGGDIGQVGQQQVTSSSKSVGRQQSLVLTPGGFRHPSLVHYVERDHEVHHSTTSKRIRNIHTNEFHILKEEMVLPGEVPAFGSGWICYASWMNDTGSPISVFKTTWEVPPEPTTRGQQTIFLFNGIDPMNTSTGILQPVLQWGPSAAGGGQFWSISSWYVSGDGHAYHTDLIQVNVGDRLVGLMTFVGGQDGNFNYVCEFDGITGTRLPVQNVPELMWCNETLEAYNISQCSDYPATSKTTFSDISIHTKAGLAPVTWSNETNVSECGQAAVVNPGGTVDLKYT